MTKMLIVAHDAGGAEVVSSWVQHNPKNSYSFILAGPAKSIFKKKLKIDLIYDGVTDVTQLIMSNEIILTGTSGQANLERNVIRLSKLMRKKVISFLDHWCEYEERFRDGEKLELPDEIWVCDRYAYNIAKNVFPKTKISIKNNHYLIDFNNDLTTLKHKKCEDKLRILYICEPIADYALQKYGDSNYFNYTEFDAVSYFLHVFENEIKFKHKTVEVRFRLHPLEHRNKYEKLVCNHLSHISISNSSLIEDIAWSDWVIGCSSMALIQAMLANKKVYTCIPPGGNYFKFPHRKIRALSFPKKMELYE